MDILTIEQVSERTGIKRVTLYKQAAKGKIPGAFRFADRWVIPASSLRRIKKRPYNKREPMET